MLTIADISKSFGERDLLRNASLQVNRGERIGLVGPNGAGKSTLINMILGREEPDSGEITIDRRCTVGYLPQETAQVTDENVLEIAIAVTPDMVKLRRAMLSEDHEAEIDPDHEHTDAHTLYAERNGFQLEAKAKQILHGLGFRPEHFERRARELSGGWVMRCHLARLLVQEPDLLLLDEPTNHLDLHSLLWFQEHLKGYPGAILMVSHDREFLNELIDSIVELRSANLIKYTGNYNDYLIQKEAAEANLLAAYNNQQKEIARLMLFVDRFRAKNTKAAQAQSKLKQIDRMEKVEAPANQLKTIGFSFPQPQRSGQKVLKMTDIDFGYGDNRIYTGLNFEVERHQRIVLVGPNGAGKSTLLKLCGGVLTPQGGERLLGHNVTCGYYSQNRVEMLKLDRTVYEEAMDTPSRVTEQFVRTLLGCFLFSGDDVLKPVKVLSGGEKSRLALVKLLLQPPNFLLMDEPTTHLDMASIEALIEALRQYEGTLVFISHDVYFIKQLANHVVHVEDGAIKQYPGNYQYYVDKTGRHNPGALSTPLKTSGPAQGAKPSGKTKEQKRLEAEERQAKSNVRKQQQQLVNKLEQQITDNEKRQEEIIAELNDPAAYTSGRAMELNRELKDLGYQNDQLNKKWEAAAIKLEQLGVPKAESQQEVDS
ncbi:MAG: ABC-F family ATP-binding cassette domain-containing protein [Verrucomicrobiales bacterium]